MSDTTSRPPCVLPYATPAAKLGISHGVTPFAKDFLCGSTLTFAITFLVVHGWDLWEHRASGMYVSHGIRNIPFFLTCVAVVSAASALAAAAGAGVKRCVLGSAVSSARWAGLAGGMFSAAASLGCGWAFQHREPTACILAVAAPVIAGFLLVRRAPEPAA